MITPENASKAGKASWASRTPEERKAHISLMNKNRAKKQAEIMRIFNEHKKNETTSS